MAVRFVVYGSAHGSVRLSGSAAICDSTLGSVWQCAWQCCAAVRQCGSMRQCAAVRAAVCGSACGSVCAVVWGSAHSTSLCALCAVRAAVCSSALGDALACSAGCSLKRCTGSHCWHRYFRWQESHGFV
jgi:hypothetical protein